MLHVWKLTSSATIVSVAHLSTKTPTFAVIIINAL